jgi:DNA-binding transcriptional LysR family regulator
MTMQWDDLRFFLAVARSRTLHGAADRLGVDATTVGRRIDRLSGALASNLFESGPGGHRLTSHGETLLAHAEEVERSMLAASDALTGERGRLGGTVRLSLSEGLAAWIIAPALADFRAAHPDIALEIATANGFLNPSRREADLAVMLARPARGPLLSQKLTDYGIGLYATSGYLAEKGAPATVADLRERTMIGYIPDFIYAEELRYLAEFDAELHSSLSSSSINIQYAMTRAGLGIAALPHFIGRQDRTLVPVLAAEAAITRNFWLVVHRDLRRTARVAAVVDWLHDVIGAAKVLGMMG